MSGGSQQLRRFRIARRDGASVEDAAVVANMSIGEARLTAVEDAKNPPPAEAYALIGERPQYGRVEHIGGATLYLGRCEDVLPMLQRPDAIVSDPPYGQNAKLNTFYAGGTRDTTVIQRSGKLLAMSPRAWPDRLEGDDRPFDPADVLAAADKVLLWGAHKYGDRLPRGRWFAWDKVPTGKVRDQGDGELAWTNHKPDAALRIYRLLWDGVCVGSAARHEVTAGQQREHPTQKPEALMAWCLTHLDLAPDSLICDPYMGAGSTGMAAVKAGHRFVGIECEPLYFDAACRRIDAAQRQGFLPLSAAA